MDQQELKHLISQKVEAGNSETALLLEPLSECNPNGQTIQATSLMIPSRTVLLLFRKEFKKEAILNKEVIERLLNPFCTDYFPIPNPLHTTGKPEGVCVWWGGEFRVNSGQGKNEAQKTLFNSKCKF